MSICSFAVPVLAAARLSRSLLIPAASLVTIFVAVAASTLVAYDTASASTDSTAAALLISAATANVCAQQFHLCTLTLPASLICRAARLVRAR
eukprot:824455-Pleurochrysis_carterae.AAC.1